MFSLKQEDKKAIKKYLISKSVLLLAFLLTCFFIEIYTFLYLGFNPIAKYFFLNFFILLFIFFACMFIPNNLAQYITLGFFILLQILLSYTNICINDAMGDLFSFNQLGLMEETVDVVRIEMFPVVPIIIYLLFLIAYSVICIVHSKVLKAPKVKYSSVIGILVNSLSLIVLTFSYIMYSLLSCFAIDDGKKDGVGAYLSDKFLYTTFNNKKTSLVRFGTWGFYFEDFFRWISGYEPNMSGFSEEDLLAFVNSGEYDPTKLSLYGVCENDNVITILLESFEWFLISEEMTPTLYALARGYDFGVRDSQTGLYSNFNFYDFGIDSNGFTTLTRKDYTKSGDTYIKKSGVDLFPNEEFFDSYGLTFESYYANSKTDYTETSVLLGSYPSVGSSVVLHPEMVSKYGNLDFGFSLPNMLKRYNKVDVTNYLHAYKSTEYARNKLMPKYGYDNLIFIENMENTGIDIGRRADGVSYELDYVAKDGQVLDYFLNHKNSTYNFLPTDKRFFSTFTTVTTHGTFAVENPLIPENYKFVDSVGYLNSDGSMDLPIYDAKEPALEKAVRTYYASALETEYSATILLKYLMENNLFDKTTILMYGDHRAYYDGISEYYKCAFYSDSANCYDSPIEWRRDGYYGVNNGVDKRFYYNSNLHHLPAFIYSTKINDGVVGIGENAHTITKFTTIWWSKC